MTTTDLHPLACEVLDAFPTLDFFRSKRLAMAVTEREPKRCLRWSLELMKQRLHGLSPPDVIVQLLGAIETALATPAGEALIELDRLAWACWCSENFDDTTPFLQRAIARLGWAAMYFVCRTTGVCFTSQVRDFSIDGNRDGNLLQMANECAMAIDMTYTHTYEGRFLIAKSFSREMQDE